MGSCKEKEIYPVIPSLEWKSNYFLVEHTDLGNDTLIGVIVTYKDGDGDVGLGPGDTLPPFNSDADSLGNIRNPNYYNFKIEYLEYKNGILQPFIIPNTNDTFKVETRIASLTPEGVHKAIRGDIKIEFSPPLYIALRSDSIVLRAKLFDRDLHQSNVVESPLIVLP